jgi:hypothetical protein
MAGRLGDPTQMQGTAALNAEDTKKLAAWCAAARPPPATAGSTVTSQRTLPINLLLASAGDVTSTQESDANDATPEAENTAVSANGLRGLDFFDSVTYDSLGDWVPTAGLVPANLAHSIALLRGAICKDMLEARGTSDTVTEARAGKLLTFLDRLLFFQEPRTRGGKRNRGTATQSRVLATRVRMAWNGVGLFMEGHGVGHGKQFCKRTCT